MNKLTNQCAGHLQGSYRNGGGEANVGDCPARTDRYGELRMAPQLAVVGFHQPRLRGDDATGRTLVLTPMASTALSIPLVVAQLNSVLQQPQ